MGFIELVCDSTTADRAADQQYDATDYPMFKFGAGIKERIIGMKVSEVQLPISWYNWVDDNVLYNGSTQTRLQVKFRYSRNPPPGGSRTYYLTLDPGTYTGPEIADAFNTLLNDATLIADLTSDGYTPPFNNSCTWNTSSQSFTWVVETSGGTSGADGMSILFQEEFLSLLPFPAPDVIHKLRVAHMIGLPMTGGLFTQVGNTFTLKGGFANLNAHNFVYLNSKTLGPLFKCRPNFLDKPSYYRNTIIDSSKQLALVPLDANFGEVVQWQAPEKSAYYEIDTNDPLSNFDLYFTFGPESYPLRFNGQGWQVKLLIEYEDIPGTEDNKKRKFY